MAFQSLRLNDTPNAAALQSEPLSDRAENIARAANALLALMLEGVPDDGITEPAVAAMWRNAMRAAMKERGILHGIMDGRVLRWHIAAEYWHAPNGQDYDSLLAGTETRNGFEGVAMWLRDGAVAAFASRGGLPPACTVPHLMHKLDTVRPAISRGDGRANFRYRFASALGVKAMLIGTVTRADKVRVDQGEGAAD